MFYKEMEFKLIKEILPCLVTCYGSDCQAIFLIFCHFLAISPRKFLPKMIKTVSHFDSKKVL